MNRGSLATLAAVAVGVCSGAWSDNAAAFCRMTTESPPQVGDAPCVETGFPLTWKRRCLTYAIDGRGSATSPDLTPEETRRAVDSAFSAWENANCEGTAIDLVLLPLEDSTCREAEFNERGGNVNTVAFDSLGSDASNAFAITVVFHDRSTGRILDADILLNDDLGPFDECPAAGCPVRRPGNRNVPVDLQGIVTHEAGHYFGIGHSDDEEATMFAEATGADTGKRTLAQDDIDAICTIYPPGSCAQACPSAAFPPPVFGLDLNCEDGIAPPSDTANVDVCFGANGGGGGCTVHHGGTSRRSLLAIGVLAAAMLAMRRRRR